MKNAWRLLGIGAVLPLLFVSCASVAASTYDGSFPRVVNVCVLNDKEEPASEKIIRHITGNVFREYEERIAVRFVAAAFVASEVDLDIWPPLGVGLEAKDACPKDTEVRMIFSNRRMLFIGEDGKEGELAGLSHDYYGLLVIFNVGGRVFLEDKGGNPALETSLKHEIAHIFGLEHTKDINSFLYKAGNKSQGRWTDEILEQLLKARNKKWH